MSQPCSKVVISSVYSLANLPPVYRAFGANLSYGFLQVNSSQVTYTKATKAQSFTNTSQMARKTTRSNKQVALTVVATQPKMDPSAIQSLTLDGVPTQRSTLTADHYSGTRRNRRRRRHYKDEESTWIVPSASDSTTERGHTSAVGSDHARQAVWGDSEAKFICALDQHHDKVIASSLPYPNRTGYIDTRPSWRDDERSRESSRMPNNVTSINSTSTNWPSGSSNSLSVSSWASPLGAHQMSQSSAARGFTAYHPLRSVRSCRKVPPRHIDKFARFTHTAAMSNGPVKSEVREPHSRGRWTESPPERTVRYAPRFNQIRESERTRRPARPSPEVEGSDYLRHKFLPQPLPTPIPTAQYLQQAAQQPQKSESPRPLLLVVDLNGTLVERKPRSHLFVERPHLAPFLKYVFENHTLMIWSSALPDNVDKVCQSLFTKKQRRKVIGEWGRDTLDLTAAQYRAKVQVYKRLDKIWHNDTLSHSHPDAGRGAVWDQSNTILIDDSRAKAAAQPHNLLEIPEFRNTPERKESDVLRQVAGYLEELRSQEDVSAFMRKRSFRLDDGWCCPWLGGSKTGSDGA